MKKIYFISDQFFPRTSADSEQIISSLSTLTNLADVTLLSASYASKENPTRGELEEYYGRKCEFNLRFINHLFKNIRGFEKLTFALRAAFRVRKSNCELVYTRNIPIVIAILLLTENPIVFESYRPWPNRNILSKIFFKKLSKVTRFLGVVLHSNFAKKSFLDVGFDNKSLIVAHNAFDFDLYRDSDRNSIRDKFKLPKDKIITTYSGRVNRKKGLLRLLNLAKSFPDHFFLLIGSEKNGFIETESKQFENVKVLKWQDRQTVYSLLQASDILYIPPTLAARDISKNTVLPIKTFLYKASGKAIFGPRSEDIEEVLNHGNNAFLVEPDNDKDELKGFKQLIGDQKLRDTLGANAKEEMVEMTWHNRSSLIMQFIEDRILQTDQLSS